MGDRMFASGSDSVHVGDREPSPGRPSPWEDRWSRGNDTGRREIPADADATAGVVRRLQARVDRHRWLLGRMQSDPLQPEPAGLPELLETVARMRRDTESLLLLHGQDPRVPAAGAARRLSDVLAAAVAAAEEPRRVDVRPAPAAGVAPVAATELLHVLAEVVDHVTAVYPGARVDVSCAAETPGGVVVEIRADGAAHHDPDGQGGRRALGAARRLAQRSRSGIVLHADDGGARGAGPVASIHCPGSVVTLDPAPARDPERALTAWAAHRQRSSDTLGADTLGADTLGADTPSSDTRRTDALARDSALDTRAGGANDVDPNALATTAFDSDAFGTDSRRSDPLRSDPLRSDPLRSDAQRSDVQGPTPRRREPVSPLADPPGSDLLDPLSGPLPLDRLFAESTRLEPPPPGSSPLDFTPSQPDIGLPQRANGNGRNGHGRTSPTMAPAYVPSAGSQVDELFGPMPDLARDPAADDGATPIFEAVASAWFREDAPPAGDPLGRSPVNGARQNGPRHGGGHGGSAPFGSAPTSSAPTSSARHAGPRNGRSGASTADSRALESGPRNWESPSDLEWQAAAERAARPEPEAQTSNGLPRRRPGNQLVPPARGGTGVPEPERPDRVPDRVRERLSTYQRGLRQGRHRAEPSSPDSDPGDPAAW